MAFLAKLIFFYLIQHISAITDEIQLLNELSVEKLMQLKSSLQPQYENKTEAPYLENFGAQAMAVKAPKRRSDHKDLYKEESKISHIFTMSVTTLAFLAFGGYLLCLIVHAVKSKQNTAVVTPQPTFFVNAGIKRPQTQFASYGRKKRDLGELLPPDEVFLALMRLCEGYAKWSDK
ncbi:unnamed protein product [Leptosia nina]|uniref:Uncharacterized protein n=1 Tax=Leptosia nina TaxID=320188 RepID=A0AAV1J3F5_9NEOP